MFQKLSMHTYWVATDQNIYDFLKTFQTSMGI